MKEKIANAIKSNSKTFWAHLNSKTKSKSGITDLEYTKDNEMFLTSHDEEKAEVQSEFFASLFTKEPEGDLPKLSTVIDDISLTLAMLEKKLKILNPNKSLGLDGINPKMLVETTEIIKIPLFDIYKKKLTRM